MLPSASAANPLSAERPPWLRGRLDLPGDAMVSDLALCCAAVARGTSMIEGAPGSRGTAALTEALRALGVRVEQTGARWYLTGLGAGGLLEPLQPLDLSASAFGGWLVMGLAGIYDFPAIVRFHEQAGQRRIGQFLALLAEFGIIATSDAVAGKEVALHGPRLGRPADLTLPPDGPAMKAGLLLAALGVPARSSFFEPVPGWDHAERMLAQFGVPVRIEATENPRRIEIQGLTEVAAQQIAVPADPSLAAFGAMAASIVPASEIEIGSVLVNPRRTAVLSALVALGARIEVRNLREVHGEQVADLGIRQEGLRGVALGARHVAGVIGELPLLAAAAAFADGDSVFHLPPDLPMLDRAHVAALARGLVHCGIEAVAEEEMLTVKGAGRVKGGVMVDTVEDTAMALAFLGLGMGAEKPVTIPDQSVLEERCPGFVERFENIGASFIRGQPGEEE
jgi:3-phosphoshikimate 1-carboxyvinyltransferase